MSFLAAAGKRTGDIREFLREASGGSGIKYKPGKGEKHIIYIPYKIAKEEMPDGTFKEHKEVISMYGAVHEWNGLDDKYKATICLKGVVRTGDNGEMLNDGSCPFCDSVGKAWDIYRYRYENEQLTCGKTGAELDKHMETMKKRFADDRKAKDAKEYLYLLVAKYRTDPARGNQPIMGSNGLPEFDLKIMKLAATRIEKILQQVENAGGELAGCELIFDYPNENDPRLVVSQSTTAPIFEQRQFVHMYPGLKEAIQAEVNKFSWDGIEKSFPEWAGMTSAEAEKTVTQLFSAWDNYQKELEVNPGAKYLEYVGAKGGSNPSLTGDVPQIPANPGAATSSATSSATTAPNGMPGVAGMGIPDANAIFSNMQGGPVQMPGTGNNGVGGINI